MSLHFVGGFDPDLYGNSHAREYRNAAIPDNTRKTSEEFISMHLGYLASHIHQTKDCVYQPA